MSRTAVRFEVRCVLAALVAGCAGRHAGPTSTLVDTSPLSGLVGQALAVTPTQRARVAAELGWTDVPPGAQLAAALDSSVRSALRARDVGRAWVFGEALARNYARNPTYATDPRSLSVESLRAPGLQVGARLVEPLASQVRTMIALADARLVLIPVDYRIEVARTEGGSPAGRGAVRLVLVDPRTSDVRLVGEVAGDVVPRFGPAVAASVARRVADLFAAAPSSIPPGGSRVTPASKAR